MRFIAQYRSMSMIARVVYIRIQFVLMLSGAGISTGATALRDIQQIMQMLQVAFMISAILSMRLSS